MVIDLADIEGTCLDLIVEAQEIEVGWEHESYIGWLEVQCSTHEWKCMHRHTRWGPILRCLTRHVASMVEVEV